MTLRVEFDQFVSTVKRIVGEAPVYVASLGRGTLATAARPQDDVLVVSRAPLSIEETRARLAADGLDVYEGQWSMDWSVERGAGGAFVVAVAYMSGSGKPGLWVDASAEEPSPAQALKTMHLEMTANGEVAEVPFEDFIQAANPTVLVLSPQEIEHFMRDSS